MASTGSYHAATNYTSCSQIANSTGSSAMSLKVIGILNIVAVLPTLMMNFCVLIAIIRTSVLRTTTNAILCCILLINLLQGCVSLPWYGVLIIRIAANKSDCMARDVVGYLGASFAVISMLSVDLLTYERYVAISSPFKHETRFTKTRIKAAVVGIWVASFAMMSTLKIKSLVLIGVIFATVVIVGTYVFNVVVHVLIHRIVTRLRTQQNSLRPNIADTDSQAAFEQQRKERRTIKFSVYIIFFLLACYLPSVFKNVLSSLSISANIFMAVANTFLMMHATFSPVLYIWQSPQIGRAVKRLVQCRASAQVSLASP